MKVEFQMKNDRSDPHLQFTFMNEEKLDLNINGQRMADIMEDLEVRTHTLSPSLSLTHTHRYANDNSQTPTPPPHFLLWVCIHGLCASLCIDCMYVFQSLSDAFLIVDTLVFGKNEEPTVSIDRELNVNENNECKFKNSENIFPIHCCMRTSSYHVVCVCTLFNLFVLFFSFFP